MNQKQTNEFLEYVLEIGKLMMEFGAEIGRVEDSILRILKTYNIVKYEIYATTTLIVVTIKTDNDIIASQSVRVGKHSINLGALESLNNLSREICFNKPPIDEINKLTNKIKKSVNLSRYNSIGYILSAWAFAIFFGGNFMDGICAGIVGYCVYLMDHFFEVSDDNRLIIIVIMSFIAGLLSILLVKIGVGSNSDKIIIGVAMLFVSTLSLVTGVKDMFYRHIISGCFRVIESVICGVFIAVGFGLSMILTGVIL